jgi:hypothetical protein
MMFLRKSANSTFCTSRGVLTDRIREFLPPTTVPNSHTGDEFLTENSSSRCQHSSGAQTGDKGGVLYAHVEILWRTAFFIHFWRKNRKKPSLEILQTLCLIPQNIFIRFTPLKFLLNLRLSSTDGPVLKSGTMDPSLLQTSAQWLRCHFSRR